jgi:hypothetical protein
MEKRLLGMLVIGGVAVLCIAPNVHGEDRTTLQWEGNAASKSTNVAAIEAPTPSPTSAESQRPKALPAAEEQAPERYYRPLVESISRINGVDPDLIDAMIRTESNYNPWAISPKGARGLMQLIPETGRRFGVSNFFDPKQNIEGGVRYFKYLLDMFGGNIDLSLAAYNAGENLVARLGKIPPYPETWDYVRKIRAVYTKPSETGVASSIKSGPSAQRAPGGSSKKEPAVAASTPEKPEEPPVLPISNWMDDRGVRHFSNIEPLK